MPRVSIIDKRLVVSFPVELIEVPDDERVRQTILEMVDDIVTIRISLHSLTDYSKQNLLEALMTNAEAGEAFSKPDKERVVCITRRAASRGGEVKVLKANKRRI